MRSSLKKSLYLGLAALSFASVAGVAFNNVNADAKKATKTKKAHKKAKKSTKKAKKAAEVKITSIANIDNQSSQAVGFTVSGNITNKPAGVAGAKTVATGIPSNEVFMKYQTVTLSNKETYYKVVSFDKKYRGFVSASQLQNTATYSPASDESSLNLGPVYLAYPGNQNIYSLPLGGTFKPQYSVRASETAKLANVQFGVNGKQVVKSTGATVYHIVDLANPTIQGWVDSSAVTTSANRYFDQGADIKVNYVNNGNTVASQIVNVTNNHRLNGIKSGEQFQNLSTDRVLDDEWVQSIFDFNGSTFTVQDADSTVDASKLLAGAGSGYAVTKADYDYSLQNIKNVKVGDTVNINVTSIAKQDQVTSQLKFKTIAPTISGSGDNVSVQWNPADAKDVDLSHIANLPSLNSDGQAAYNADFTGNKNTFVGTNNKGLGLSTIFNVNDPLFGNSIDAPFNTLIGNVSQSITSTSEYTNGYINNAQSSTDNNNDNQTRTNAYNNQISGMLAFASDKDVKEAASKLDDNTLTLAKLISDNRDNLSHLKIGQAYHYVYVIDRQATLQYNQWATLYGQPVTAVYDAVPVATAPASSTTTSSSVNYIYGK